VRNAELGEIELSFGNKIAKAAMNKLKDYLQLIKLSLSIMVVFSSVISYLLAPKVVEYEWVMQ
jgi:heme O synthase-like polyprenyltransferase